MSWKWYTWVVAVLAAMITALAVAGVDACWICCCAVLQAILLCLLVRSVRKPLSAVENGIYLLREQDFSTKLCLTGQSDADRVVALFNSMMDTMKEERLKNLEQENFLEQLMKSSPMGIAICGFNREVIRSNPSFKRYASRDVMKVLMSLKDGESAIARPEPSLVLRCSRHWFMDSGFRRPYFLIELLTQEVIEAEANVYNKIVRTMGHEVNNTLGSVVSVLESLEALDYGDASVSDAIESSRKRCLNLVDFVKSYADIVKLPEPALSALDLNEWIVDLKPFIGQMLTSNIELVVDTAGASSPIVMADSSLLERVIVNVVMNAIESIGDSPGRIRISLIENGFVVSDNGKGIPNDVAQRIFTPFFSTKKADRGLGLMLVAEVLRRHNAKFSLFTDTKDGLTKFVVNFGNNPHM